MFLPVEFLLLDLIIAMTSQEMDTTPNIVSRSGWNAREPKDMQELSVPVPKVIVHHSVMGEDQSTNYPEAIVLVQEIQNFHMDDRKWSDIGYSFLVGGDGTIYEGRSWDRIGAHTLGYNQVSIGICLLGNFSAKLPPTAQMDATKQLIAYGVERSFINRDYLLLGHRDTNNKTECPGQRFYEELSTWPHKGVAE